MSMSRKVLGVPRLGCVPVHTSIHTSWLPAALPTPIAKLSLSGMVSYTNETVTRVHGSFGGELPEWKPRDLYAIPQSRT